MREELIKELAGWVENVEEYVDEMIWNYERGDMEQVGKMIRRVRFVMRYGHK